MIITAMAMAMLSGAAAEGPESYGPSTSPCDCTREADFYRPWAPRPPITVQAPGIRVVGRPVYVEGPSVRVQGPPVIVEAPPIRVAPAQIYIQRPDVRVRPSDITIEPPVVHFQDCKDVGPIGSGGGVSCPPVHSGSGGGSYAPPSSGQSGGSYAPAGPSYPAGAAPARGGGGRYE